MFTIEMKKVEVNLTKTNITNIWHRKTCVQTFVKID